MKSWHRIAIWFGSVVLAAALFSVMFTRTVWAWFVFATALEFSLPVAVLYLPIVLAFKDAEGRRLWFILMSGILIGPVSLTVVGLIQLRGHDANFVWYGDGLDWGVFQCMIYAVPVGLFTTAFYVLTLRFIHRNRSTQMQERLR